MDIQATDGDDLHTRAVCQKNRRNAVQDSEITSSLNKAVRSLHEDNMNKIMDLSGRLPQLVDTSVNKFFIDDQLDTLISTKKTTARNRTRKSPFRQHHKQGNVYPAATEPTQQAAPAQHLQQPRKSEPRKEEPKFSSKGREGVCDFIQESNPEQIFPETGKFTKVFFEGECRGAPEASKFGKRLMEILRTRGPAHGHLEGSCSSLVKESYRGEDRQPPLCIGSPGVQQPFGGALLQDGDPDIHMQDDQEERLHSVLGLGESLHACSDPPDMQEIPEVCLERTKELITFNGYMVIYSDDKHASGSESSLLEGPAEEIERYIKSSSSKKSCWEICVDIFRQHHVDFLLQEVWRNHFKSIIENFRRHLVTLSEIEYPTANEVCPNITQSCGCTKQAHGANGVVSIERNLQEDRSKFWSRESYNDNSDSVMGISNLVSNPLEANTRGSDNNTSYGDCSRSQKRKIPTDGQQTMDIIGLEDHWGSLKDQGYNKEAIAPLLLNEKMIG
ncbi:hypothetical protein AYI68_g7254 [Smittium mucronatum]|uniref:Uncharacterized protein n=1 Tax=Smittium mucronatum TaxID=133383 RepID=A0A1R0GP86_9FUNG|nr:hypothetical protein AYI68_g7254 [Smittium mucronatum]